MTSQQILQSDLIDILFDGRNKAYGAYQLRRGYTPSLLKAIGIAALMVIALMFFVPSSATKVQTKFIADTVELTPVVLPPEKVKPPEPITNRPATLIPPTRTEVLTNDYQIKEQSHNPPSSQIDFIDANPGSEQTIGKPAGGPPAPPDLPSGIGVGKPEERREEAAPALPSRQPQFPGGQAAWLRFLERFLQSPEEMEEGERRTVSVKFVVDEEGTITNFQVIQSGGAAFDNEVIRVLKKMPKWLPAIQNGKPATATFTQPVTFAVQ